MEGNGQNGTTQTDATTANSPVGPSFNSSNNIVDNENQNLPGTSRNNGESADQNRRVNYNMSLPDDYLAQETLRELRELKIYITGSAPARGTPPRDPSQEQRSFHRHAHDLSYGRSMYDIRNQRGSTVNFLTLKDARNMIPDVDGTSRDRVKEFINASAYAMKNVHPAEEHSLLEAIICTKFKGKVMTDFQTRDIRNYEQLKRELEIEYLSKRSTAHLQIEFNLLIQKSGESAQDFGRRAKIPWQWIYMNP